MKDREKESAKGKSDRKSDRKKARALNILKNDTGISESTVPTCTLFICNAGLTTGCSVQNLLPVFSPYGPIQSIVLIPAKSYSFVVFQIIESAVQCMDGVNCKIGVDEDGVNSGGNKAGISGPLYLSFVDHAPQLEDNWCEKLPSGLEVLEAFISSQEEKELLGLFDWTESSSLDGAMKHRQVKHFGYEFNYTTNNIDPNLPLEAKIPDPCLDVCQRAVDKGLIDVLPDQLTVNRYLPGQGIPPHTDTHSCCTTTILSLSLGSSTVMQFRGPGAKLVSVLLPAMSLLVMSGESRYVWTHGITPHKHDVVKEKGSGGLTLLTRGERVSLTFRKTLAGPCVCSYPLYCDSVAKESSDKQGKEAVEEDTAAKLEALHVHQVYETIADHFSDTRHKPWPQVLEFLKMLDPGSVLLDLGCGNGKYLGQEGSESRMEIGMDYSQGLLDIVLQRGHQACRSDLLFVPCRDNVADGIICIAALHHLSTTVRRLSSLREMTRVLAPGGKFLIYVWAKDQRKGEASSYLKQNKKNFKKSQAEVKVQEEEIGQFGLPVHVNRTQFKHQDLLVPWKLKNEKTPEICENSPVFQRYYHVFEEGELEGLIGQIDQLTVIRSYYDQGNHCVIAQKI